MSDNQQQPPLSLWLDTDAEFKFGESSILTLLVKNERDLPIVDLTLTANPVGSIEMNSKVHTEHVALEPQELRQIAFHIKPNDRGWCTFSFDIQATWMDYTAFLSTVNSPQLRFSDSNKAKELVIEVSGGLTKGINLADLQADRVHIRNETGLLKFDNSSLKKNLSQMDVRNFRELDSEKLAKFHLKVIRQIYHTDFTRFIQNWPYARGVQVDFHRWDDEYSGKSQIIDEYANAGDIFSIHVRSRISGYLYLFYIYSEAVNLLSPSRYINMDGVPIELEKIALNEEFRFPKFDMDHGGDDDNVPYRYHDMILQLSPGPVEVLAFVSQQPIDLYQKLSEQENDMLHFVQLSHEFLIETLSVFNQLRATHMGYKKIEVL